MREQPNMFQIGSSRRLWQLAGGLALLPLLCLPSWAETFNLNSVDFAANGDQTNIILHTGSIVPVQKVLVSTNKVVLDIDQINADDTVKTNFVQASNISHVIMQPLGEHKVRMIIRGENLGMPSVAFYNPSVGAYSQPNPGYHGSKLQEETAAALKGLQAQGTKPAALGLPEESSMAEQPAVDSQPITNLQSDASYEDVIQPAPTSKTPVDTLSEPLTLPANNLAAPGAANPFLGFKLPRTWETYIPYALLALVVLGVGSFIGYRVMKLKNVDVSLEDIVDDDEPMMAKSTKSSFKEKAAEYRNRREQSQPAALNRKSNNSDMIGLRGLKDWSEPQDEILPPAPKKHPSPAPVQKIQPAPAAESNKALETLMAALQKNAQAAQQAPATKLPAQKQVINQYRQAQPATAEKKPIKPAQFQNERDAEYQEALQRELKRAQDVQNQVKKQLSPSPLIKGQKPATAPKTRAANPVNQAPAARKANVASRPASPFSKDQQGPLPGNPEVLNFLRNVADLMEKDGKGDIAKSIHKNLNGNLV